MRLPSADGAVTYGNDSAVIDASHTCDGYVMIQYSGSAGRVKVRITKDTQYTYDLNPSGSYETFPLTEGSGTYSVAIFEQVEGMTYRQSLIQPVIVMLSDERMPFLYPNQFCSYNAESAVVDVSDAVCRGLTDPLQKIAAIYHYTADTLTYDYGKAASVPSGYLPDIDSTLATHGGICFDYASTMTAMLRLQDIPAKLVIGYADSQYHAWVSVYADVPGRIDDSIVFDDRGWHSMDPTFASAGRNDPAVITYLTDPSHYNAKFTY